MPKKKLKQRRPRPKKRAFVIAPFPVVSAGLSKLRKHSYVKVKEYFRNIAAESFGGYSFSQFVEVYGVGKQTTQGLVIDYGRVNQHLVNDPADVFCGLLHTAKVTHNANVRKKAYVEVIQVMKQLHAMGHQLHIQNSNVPENKIFIKAAMKNGANLVNEFIRDPMHGDISYKVWWARDQWVTIGSVREPHQYTYNKKTGGKEGDFGEGGTVVQIGAKNFAIADGIQNNPRLKKYKEKGYIFQPMPDCLAFDTVLSDLFGMRILQTSNHIDYVLGGIPEKKIVAVDSIYAREHKMSMSFLEQNTGVKIVTAPMEESDRHSVNFLPLGKGRVFVDKGCPKFIAKLRKTGVTVIPTVVPMDNLRDLKGGLHCLFNEH